ncbi:hypothetical protein EON65_51075, partial [archaeon]
MLWTEQRSKFDAHRASYPFRSHIRGVMVIWRRSSGKRVYNDLAKDPAVLQDLGPICRALRTSGLFIDNKAQLTEVFLANLLTNLRNHYEVQSPSYFIPH